MKLVLEADAEMYERIAGGDLSVVVGRVLTLEASQEDGLLNCERRVISIQEMSGLVAEQTGVGDGVGSPIRVFLADPEKEVA